MANTLITPPEVDQDTAEPVTRTSSGFHTASRSNAAPNLGEPAALQSTNPFQSLVQNVRDAFFPEKLPPLVLESQPIAVADPMAVKRDPVSTGVAVGVHALAFLLIIWISAKAIKTVILPKKDVKNISFDVPPPPPVIHTPPAPQAHGGGGQHDIAPVPHGAPPKFSPVQIIPPTAPPKIEPKLAVAPTVDVDLRNKMKSDLPNIGLPNSPNVGVFSGGTGNGNGLGSGNGNGIGPGFDRGVGGGHYSPGVDGVSYPKLIYQVEPEFSEEARKAKFQGEVLVHLIVDAAGRPTRVSVTRRIGMGLDEKAVEAVSQYRFKPAMKDGKAVPVLMDVAVNFQIF